MPELGPYSNYYNKDMETVIWVLYLSQEIYLIGLVFSLLMGFIFVPYLWVVGLMQLFDGTGTFEQWLAGPFLSYYIVQPFIFTISIVLGIVPGVNFISAFLLGWWSNLDYYQYNYELFAGPTLPQSQ